MSKNKTFSRQEEMLRLLIPIVIVFPIIAFLRWIALKIIHGIIYLWDLIDWNSVKEWLTTYFFSWWAIGIILFVVALLYVIKLFTTVGKNKTSSSPIPKPSPAPSGPRLKTYIVWSLGLIALYMIIGYAKGWSEWWTLKRLRQDELSMQLLPPLSIPVSSTNTAVIHYGRHLFTQGIPQHYMRGSTDEYFYPVRPGTTIILRFQQCSNPASHWDYRVTRRLDGTIQTGDDERLNDHDQRGWGEHTVTLLSNDALVEYSDHPANN